MMGPVLYSEVTGGGFGEGNRAGLELDEDGRRTMVLQLKKKKKLII